MRPSVLLFALLWLCASCFQVFAQDTIVLKTGNEIIAKVSEITIDMVKYKKFDNLSGPDYYKRKPEVLLIRFANGTKEEFKDEKPHTSEIYETRMQLAGPSDSGPATGEITDSRDGKSYKTITIGTQTWMAQNLNYDIPFSWCFECETYGRSYTYEAAKKSCPLGWHLPSEAEWTVLTDVAGGGSVVGGNLKETGSLHWKSPNTGATNSSGFTALPHGFRTLMGQLSEPTKFAMFWTSTEAKLGNIVTIRLDYNKSTVTNTISDRNVGLSIRCLKD